MSDSKIQVFRNIKPYSKYIGKLSKGNLRIIVQGKLQEFKFSGYNCMIKTFQST